jgi:hypothetical protein
VEFSFVGTNILVQQALWGKWLTNKGAGAHHSSFSLAVFISLLLCSLFINLLSSVEIKLRKTGREARLHRD